MLTKLAGIFFLVLTSRCVAANVVITWDNAVLQAIRTTRPGPPIAARDLAIVHTCMFDAWTPYTSRSIGTRLGGSVRVPARERTEANKQEAMSYAAYRCANDLFRKSATFDPAQLFDPIMTSLGYDRSVTATGSRTPAQIGNLAAEMLLNYRHHDGSNQLGDLGPLGTPYSDYTGYSPENTPTQILNPDAWQPLQVPNGKGGFTTQVYTAPFWGYVEPFALSYSAQFTPNNKPATHTDRLYREQADQILSLSANLTDEQKVIAEYWADFPGTALPPGHWAAFGQFVSFRDQHTLDQDVQMFFALTNALFDGGIACWEAKRFANSERPITAVHWLYGGDTIYAWAGPGKGSQWIKGEDWQPYQPVTVVTPSFPEWVSGHSTFSAAAAEIFRRFTQSDYFGDSVTVLPGTSSVEPGFAPRRAVTLHWETFSEAAAQAGISRRYGGIHFEQGDLQAREMGRQIGELVWEKAQSYINPDGRPDDPADRGETSGLQRPSTGPTTPVPVRTAVQPSNQAKREEPAVK